MPFFSGFAGEFGRQLERNRADEADRAERQNALESSVLQHLATSPDPEIASHAITGLLDLASPQRKAKGLAGWLGKVAEHPALPTIRQLIQAGKVENIPGTEHVPAMRVGGMPADLPGQAIDVQGQPQAATPPPGGAIPWGGGQPQAATPPPQEPVVASGDVYRAPQTRTVPRKVFLQPGELEAQQAGEKERAVLTARGQAYDEFAASPGKQSLIPGINNPPAPHPEGEWQDPVSKQWYKQESVLDQAGNRTLTRTPISKAPTSVDAQLQARVAEIIATHPGMPPAQAEQQALAEGRATTIAKAGALADAHEARQAQLQLTAANTLRVQLANQGATPMTPAQRRAETYRAITAASTELGLNATPAEVEETAKRLIAQQGSPGGRPPRGPVVTPIRAALAAPSGASGTVAPAAAPPPALAAPTAPSAIPDRLRDASRRPDPAQIQTQQRQATKVLGHVDAIQKDIEAIDQMGLMGPIGGRWGAFLASGVGSLGGNYTPEQERLLGKFRTDMGLLKSGMAMVHGGARGGGSVQMMARMDALISADKMDKALLLGATDAFKNWLTEYAKDPAAAGAGPAATAPPAAPPTTAAPSTGPAPGTRGMINGKPAVWDGHGWLPAPAGGG